MTEYIDGGELFDEIQRRTKFPEDIASDVLKQMLISISYCHKKKIMHRDLKPENVLIDTLTPKKLVVKIIDFGSAHHFFNRGEYQPTTGTPYYIAPEVLMNNYGESCDVWSCGVILYIMISGKPPFNGSTQEDIMRAVKKASLNFSGPEWKDISEDAKDLVKKMIKYPPSTRISVENAHVHAWMQKRGTCDSSSIAAIQNVILNLTQYKVRFAE